MLFLLLLLLFLLVVFLLILLQPSAQATLPQTRAIYSKGSARVETYSFPPRHAQDAYSFATVGVSALSFPVGRPIPFEVMTLLPPPTLQGRSAKPSWIF